MVETRALGHMLVPIEVHLQKKNMKLEKKISSMFIFAKKK